MRSAVPITVMILVVLGGGLGACGKKAREEATSLKSCKSSKDCTKPNRCIRYAKGKGVCARKCSVHADCPKPLLCTGEYQWVKYGTLKVGRVKHFCRPANRAEGESCTNIKHGCKKGLGCVAGKCYRGCAEVADCASDKTCVTLEKKKVCLEASIAEGAACKVRGMIRCQRGLRCYGNACVRSCSKARPCPEGHLCTGEGFAGHLATLNRKLGKPSFLFCERRRDARKEALVGRKCQRQRNCAPPNHCVKFKGVGALCVYPCRAHADCPKPFRCTGSYKPKPFAKKRIRFCRAATGKLGDPCGGRQGCQTGHRCYKSKCFGECATGKDCKDTAKCIRIVFGIALPGKRRPTAYRVCLPATLAEGNACKKGKVPYCRRGHRCHKDRCVRTCKKNADCQGGKGCKGKGYGFTKSGFKPIYRYCE